MGNRLSKIYTRTGDDGTSGLADGSRLPKNNDVFIAMGDIDELNSHIGMIDALLSENEFVNDKNAIKTALTIISHLLFNVGGMIAMPSYPGIHQKHIIYLENQIDTMNKELPFLKDFILPKGNALISQIHIARSIARRAERSMVALKNKGYDIHNDSLMFINRLSDYLFVLARFVTPTDKVTETLWNAKILDDLT